MMKMESNLKGADQVSSQTGAEERAGAVVAEEKSNA